MEVHRLRRSGLERLRCVRYSSCWCFVRSAYLARMYKAGEADVFRARLDSVRDDFEGLACSPFFRSTSSSPSSVQSQVETTIPALSLYKNSNRWFRVVVELVSFDSTSPRSGYNSRDFIVSQFPEADLLLELAGNINVHVSPHVAMTGATNFLLHDSPLSSSRFSSWYLPAPQAKAHSSISYSKSESSSLDSPHSFATAPESFDYLLVDATNPSYPATWTESGDWKVAGEVNAFDGFGRFWRGEKIGTKERKSVGILERLR